LSSSSSGRDSVTGTRGNLSPSGRGNDEQDNEGSISFSSNALRDSTAETRTSAVSTEEQSGPTAAPTQKQEAVLDDMPTKSTPMNQSAAISNANTNRLRERSEGDFSDDKDDEEEEIPLF